ncbi:MAG: hypothetical protein AAB680_07065 [Pseudomonadota bacterium]
MTEATHSAVEGAKASFPPFDTNLFSHQIFWFAIAFGALYLVLAFVILPRIGATLGQRKSTIEDDLKKAAEETEAAQSAKQLAEQAQTEARNTARATLEVMRKTILDENTKAQSAAAEQSAASMHAAEAQIAAQKSAAKAAISAEVSSIASEIYSALIGKAPTAAIIKKGAN